MPLRKLLATLLIAMPLMFAAACAQDAADAPDAGEADTMEEVAPETEATDAMGDESEGAEDAMGEGDEDDAGAMGAEEDADDSEMDDDAEDAMGATVAVAESMDYSAHLVDGEGMSLYLLLNDSPDASTCTGGCAENWPPLLAGDAEPSAGDGVDAALLGTLAREDGTTQITYNGWPLYGYASDMAPGDTAGQGAGDVWYLISPEGESIQ